MRKLRCQRTYFLGAASIFCAFLISIFDKHEQDLELNKKPFENI